MNRILINKNLKGQDTFHIIQSTGEESFISFPIQADNSNWIILKKSILAGAELQDADGNVMTQEQANEFIETLP
jgi:hypothetical protein